MSIYISGIHQNNEKKHILEPNTRYRKRIISKLKGILNILLATFDISYHFDGKQNNYKINSIFHKIEKLNFIYAIISKKFDRDIVQNILHFFVANSYNFSNLNNYPNPKINLLTKIEYNPEIHNYIFNIEIEEIEQPCQNGHKESKFCIKKGKIYSMEYLRNRLVRDTINLKIMENFTNLLKKKKNFNITEIFRLNDELIEFSQF